MRFGGKEMERRYLVSADRAGGFRSYLTAGGHVEETSKEGMQDLHAPPVGVERGMSDLD